MLSDVDDQSNNNKQLKPHFTNKKKVKDSESNHLPIYVAGERRRCRMPDCNGKSFIQCEKCMIPLCLNANRNCFKDINKNSRISHLVPHKARSYQERPT